MIGVDAWLERSPSLFEALADAGLRTGLGEQLKVLRLLQLLEERGAAPQTLAELAHRLGPVLCTRVDQFKTLQDLLGQHFTEMLQSAIEPDAADSISLGRPGRGAKPPRWFGLQWPALVLLAVACAGGVVYQLLRQARWPAVLIPATGHPAAAANSLDDPVTASAMAVGLVAVAGFLLWRRVSLALRHGQVTGKGLAQNIRIEPARTESDVARFLSAARVLNRPQLRASRMLDMRATIRATASAAGRFSPVKQVRRIPANWLLLVERGGPQDPLPAFGARLSTLLARSGVRHSLYEFRRSPEWVRRAGPKGRPMPIEAALAADRPTHVLVLAEATRVVEAKSGGPARWLTDLDVPAPLVLMTPNLRADWSAAEAAAVQAGILVLTADADGLSLLAHNIQANQFEAPLFSPSQNTQFETWQAERFTWLSQIEPASNVRTELIASLERMLSPDEFRLLVGIAAFPEVRLDLLTTLDHRLHPPNRPQAGSRHSAGSQRARLIRLGRLVWIKEGIIPDWLREDLMRALPRQELREVRERWIELLSEPPEAGDEASSLTIHLSQASNVTAGSEGDGLFLSFLKGAYDLPAPLRFIRLAGLWRAPDRTEIRVALIGLAVAGVSMIGGLDLWPLIDSALAAWSRDIARVQDGIQSFTGIPKQAMIALPLLSAVATSLIFVIPGQHLTSRSRLDTALRSFYCIVFVFISWFSTPVPTGPSTTILRLFEFVAPVAVAASFAIVLFWSPRPLSFPARGLRAVVQRSRGTGLADYPTLAVLLWMLLAGCCFLAIDKTFYPIGGLLVAVSALGLIRAALISETAAQLQPPLSLPAKSLPAKITREAIIGLVLGQISGAMLGGMLCFQLLTYLKVQNFALALDLSPRSYIILVIWHVVVGWMLFAAAAGLAAVLRQREMPCRAIYGCGLLGLVVHVGQAAIVLLQAVTPIGMAAVFLPITEIILVATMLWLPSPWIDLVRPPYYAALIVLTLIPLGALGTHDIHFKQLFLVPSMLALWPLAQRALSGEPDLASEPAQWRPRLPTRFWWVATPLLFVTSVEFPTMPIMIDFPHLAPPLAVWLAWQFGLRGYRTTIMLLLPTLGIIPLRWLAERFDFLSAIPEWLAPIPLDAAATTLTIAYLFARPNQFRTIRQSTHLGWPTLALIAIAISLQVVSHGVKSNEAIWVPQTFPILTLFLLGSADLGRQALWVIGSFLLTGLIDIVPLPAGLSGLFTGPLRPVSAVVTVCGLLAFALGRGSPIIQRFSVLFGIFAAVTSFDLVAVSLFPGFGGGLGRGSGGGFAAGFSDWDALNALAVLLAWMVGVLRVDLKWSGLFLVVAIMLSNGLALLFLAAPLAPYQLQLFAPVLPIAAFWVGDRCRRTIVDLNSLRTLRDSTARALETVARGNAEIEAARARLQEAEGRLARQQREASRWQTAPAPAATIPASSRDAPENPPLPSSEPAGDDKHSARVVFATDRKLLPGPTGSMQYGADHDVEMSFGACEVSIPQAHIIGHVELPLRFFFFALPTDPQRHFALVDSVGWSADEFRGFLAGQDSVLLFVPGFNVDFTHSVLRTAQLRFDLGSEAILYSWPSEARLTAFLADRERARRSVANLASLLMRLHEVLGSRLHVMGHGLGALAVWEALAALATPNRSISFGQIILSLPDIDVDLAVAQSERISGMAKAVTMYVSENDLALKATTFMLRTPRIGSRAMPLPGIDVIKVDEVSEGNTVWLLADIRTILKEGLPPERRFGLKRIETSAGVTWGLS